jgi:ParB family chromosome partitioning protein
MTTTIINAHEYRNLPIDQLTECPLNPRHTLDEKALNELAESIRSQGVLSPLLVRPINAQTYEVVAGKRRFRAAQLAGADSVPVDIRELTDAQCLEIAIVENLRAMCILWKKRTATCGFWRWTNPSTASNKSRPSAASILGMCFQGFA